MANTYTQIHIHVIFVVKYRNKYIHPSWKDELYKYITAIVQNKNHKVLQINGVEDHVHMLIGLRPTQSLSELMQQVKQDSSRWINRQNLVNGRFSWQSGFGAFSYSTKELPNVINYIINQEEHHRTKDLRKEYLKLLRDFEVDYDERYIFTL